VKNLVLKFKFRIKKSKKIRKKGEKNQGSLGLKFYKKKENQKAVLKNNLAFKS
jgi:hypothetical protein